MVVGAFRGWVRIVRGGAGSRASQLIRGVLRTGGRSVCRLGLALAVGVATGGCVGPFGETREAHYPDVTAAKGDGAFTRGWLPDVVPPEAKDIWEQHQVDSPRTWACFVAPEGAKSVRKLLRGLGAQRVGGPVHPGPPALVGTRGWWPSFMGSTALEAYEFKEAAGHTVVVGIEAAGHRVCLHRRD